MLRIRPASLVLAAAVALLPQLVVAAQAPVATAAQRQILATIQQFVNGVNTNDARMAAAACAPQASIIDEFPPHEWHGASACADWFHDLTAANKAEGISGGIAALGPPIRLAVTGTVAYAVFPSTYSYKQHGKPVTEAGATLTLALKRIGGNWRITGWAWSAH